MYARSIILFFFSLFALPLLAAASTLQIREGDCNTGDIQCCNSTQQSNSTTLGILSSLLGIQLPSIGGLLGLSCSGIGILGLTANSCSAQPVCCSNNQFNGLISLGCIPINISL